LGVTETTHGDSILEEVSRRSFSNVSSLPTYPPPEPQRSGLLTALVAGALIALVAANIYLYVQIDHLKTDVAKSQEKLLTEVSNLRDTSSVAATAHARRIEQLKQDLETAQT